MAVHRIPTRCNTCAKFILLRIVIAGGDQPFLFPCPHCQTEQHGWFYAQPDEAYQFRSDDLRLEDDEGCDGLAVMVATDMPVHSSFFGTQLPDHFRSPFFHNLAAVGQGEAVEQLMSRIEKLRELRRSWYAPLRRVARHYSRQDENGMRQALASVPGGKDIDWASRDPSQTFELAMAEMYEPLEDRQKRHEASVELLKLAGIAKTNHENELKALIDEYDRRILAEHRTRVADVVFAVFKESDALYPALWVEAMREKVGFDEYRVMRDDFIKLKALYQELFELSSRSLAFTAPIANLAKRGDVHNFADGKTRALHKARKEKAFNREGWLSDFPAAKALYGPISRHTRNDFGHALVRYDCRSGKLIFDDGREQNYLLFLIDNLAAVRLSHYLLDVTYIIDQVRHSVART